MGKSSWTPAMVNSLKSAIHDNKTFSVIMDELNEEYGTELSRNAVVGKAHRLGLSGAVQIKKEIISKPIPESDYQPIMRIPFSQANRSQCLYSTEDAGGGMLVCGAPAESGKSYCTDCCHEVYSNRKLAAAVNEKELEYIDNGERKETEQW